MKIFNLIFNDDTLSNKMYEYISGIRYLLQQIRRNTRFWLFPIRYKCGLGILVLNV